MTPLRRTFSRCSLKNSNVHCSVCVNGPLSCRRKVASVDAVRTHADIYKCNVDVLHYVAGGQRFVGFSLRNLSLPG